MVHLTLTGYYAGVPLCGCHKPTELGRGNTFQHAMYADVDGPDVCPACKAEWDGAADFDDTAEDTDRRLTSGRIYGDHDNQRIEAEWLGEPYDGPMPNC